MWRCLRTCMSACIRMIWPSRACRSRLGRRSTVSAVPIFCWSISGKTANAPSTARCRARCMRRILRSIKACCPAECCARWRGPADGVSYSSVLTASAPPWRSPRQRTRGLPIPRTLPAVSTPGKRRADRCLPADPLQLPDQHVERLGQHHTAALGEPFRNDNALLRRIEAFQCGMEQESLAPIVRDAANLRYHQKIGFQVHDHLQRRVSAKLETEFAGGVEKTGLAQERADETVAPLHPSAPG